MTATFLPLMACSCSSIAGMTSSELKTIKAKPLDRPVTGSIFRLTDDTSPNVAKYSRMSSSDASYKFITMRWLHEQNKIHNYHLLIKQF